MEKNCKWYFGTEGGQDVGPKDPIHETFKGNPYYSIVREAIQNSLDAVLDAAVPVNVSFEYFDLDRLQYPSFFMLEEHINQCLDYYHNNRDAKRLFGDMLKYLNGTNGEKKKLTLSCLRISDSNTKGMKYTEGDTTSPFYAFLRAGGVSVKSSNGSGGSFGFGKGAYFALSPIKTLIVSSRDIKGNVYFEGATRLTTHKRGEEKLTAFGYYDNNSGEPVLNENNIPEIFRRSIVGTDINIIGLWDEPERKDLMIKSVLNNFWLAIHNQKLTVEVDGTCINKGNLEQIIEKYFNGMGEGATSDIFLWNPTPYYKAVKYGGTSDEFSVFSGELKTLGKVKLYVYRGKGLPNRTAFFRSPNMVVFKKTSNRLNGYAAVFICDNEKGNEILQLMENPQHNEWKEENYPQAEGHIDVVANAAQWEFRDFVNRKLDSLSKVNSGNKIAPLGLEEFLSIPHELLEKDEGLEAGGENESENANNISSDLAEGETGIQTTKLNLINIKPTINTVPDLKDDANVLPNDGGDIEVTSGRRDGGGGGIPPDIPGDDDLTKGSHTDDKSESRVLRNVSLKVAAQLDNSNIVHNLIINTQEEFTNGELELSVGADNDRDDDIKVVSADNGDINGNTLKKVILAKGRNIIKIRFADNIKHTIKVKAYEVQ